MGILGRDSLEERAERLFFFAQFACSGFLIPLLERSERLAAAVDEHGTEPWDFFATAATVYFALIRLKEKVSARRFGRLANLPFDRSRWEPEQQAGSDAEKAFQDLINESYEKWYQRGWPAVSDCLLFVESKLDLAESVQEQAEVAMLSVGIWVLWNVYEEQPPDTDIQLAEAIGRALYASLVDYWE